jgi:H+/Cl- antiporter ClcA
MHTLTQTQGKHHSTPFVNIPTPNPFETAATLVCSVIASWATIFRMTLRLWHVKFGLDDVSTLKSLFDPVLSGFVIY